MKLYYIHETTNDTNRIYVKTDSLSRELIDNLNSLSVWGGCDKQGEEYKSWEIQKEDGAILQFAFALFGYCKDTSFIY